VLLLPAWAAYVASWFLPVIVVPPGDRDVYAGWKAFVTVVLGLIRPDEISVGYPIFLGSALSNVTVLLSPWMLRRTPVPLWFVIALLAGFLLNLAWVPMLEEITPLAGYWLWIGSMSLLAAVALYRRAAQVGAGRTGPVS
jgi:hypothetical protein